MASLDSKFVPKQPSLYDYDITVPDQEDVSSDSDELHPLDEEQQTTQSQKNEQGRLNSQQQSTTTTTTTTTQTQTSANRARSSNQKASRNQTVADDVNDEDFSFPTQPTATRKRKNSPNTSNNEHQVGSESADHQPTAHVVAAHVPHSATTKKSASGKKRICVFCGTTDTPMWRRGPEGKGTLCNACGVKWSLKFRKRQNGGKVDTSSPSLNAAPGSPAIKKGGNVKKQQQQQQQQQPQQAIPIASHQQIQVQQSTPISSASQIPIAQTIVESIPVASNVSTPQQLAHHAAHQQQPSVMMTIPPEAISYQVGSDSLLAPVSPHHKTTGKRARAAVDDDVYVPAFEPKRMRTGQPPQQSAATTSTDGNSQQHFGIHHPVPTLPHAFGQPPSQQSQQQHPVPPHHQLSLPQTHGSQDLLGRLVRAVEDQLIESEELEKLHREVDHWGKEALAHADCRKQELEDTRQNITNELLTFRSEIASIVSTHQTQLSQMTDEKIAAVGRQTHFLSNSINALRNRLTVQRPSTPSGSLLRDMEQSVLEIQQSIDQSKQALQFTLGLDAQDLQRSVLQQMEAKESKISSLISDLKAHTDQQAKEIKHQVDHFDQVFRLNQQLKAQQQQQQQQQQAQGHQANNNNNNNATTTTTTTQTTQVQRPTFQQPQHPSQHHQQ